MSTTTPRKLYEDERLTTIEYARGKVYRVQCEQNGTWWAWACGSSMDCGYINTNGKVQRRSCLFESREAALDAVDLHAQTQPPSPGEGA